MLDFGRNNLDRETSPYLLQHAGNPVHWQGWSAETLAHAKATDKPILLSVGYAACHWCHVMAHESFEAPETAAVMNALFVNIKVDREERPDIDMIYQQALSLLGQQGGWPLTMFLTPAGEPFWGGTYFPPEPRWGRPGFADLLRRVAEVFRTERATTVEKNRLALGDALAQLGRPPEDAPEPALGPQLLDQVAERFARDVDPVNGGFGTAPKFPNIANLTLLWRASLRSGRQDLARAVRTTLDRMCQGGIYDHLGGGFSRYSTDERWLAPHFEKMLYDNAELVGILAEVWAKTGTRLYEQRLRETVAWLRREMIADGGGFAATVDADSEGEEGRFYVWSEAEIDEVLGDDAGLFKTTYDVSLRGNWEGKTILNRLDQATPLSEEDEARLQRCRMTLLARRDKRVRPGWDDKVLADWNGLMIASLARAATLFAEPAWLATAIAAFDFVRDRMQPDGRLRHSFRQGQARHAALLDDYANMARAALELHEISGEIGYRRQAMAWVDILDRHYWDSDHGGYFLTADDAEALITRSRTVYDNPNPSGNGTMVQVLSRLWRLTGDDRYRARAEAVIAAFATEVSRNLFPLATFLNNVEFHHAADEIAIVGQRTDPATARLLAVALKDPWANRVISVVPPDASLPPTHPAFGKGQPDGRPTAYLCRNQACSLPLTDPADLARAILGGE